MGQAHCPKCEAGLLSPLADERLAAGSATPLVCPKCAGRWLAPAALERVRGTGVMEELDAGAPAHVETHRTGVCPEGHGILTRARISWDAPEHLERCNRCGGVWFDAGDFTRVANEDLLDHLDALWAPTWRRRLSEAEGQAMLKADLGETFGPELAKKLEDLAEALSKHPAAAMALAYLRRRVLAAGRPRGDGG